MSIFAPYSYTSTATKASFGGKELLFDQVCPASSTACTLSHVCAYSWIPPKGYSTRDYPCLRSRQCYSRPEFSKYLFIFLGWIREIPARGSPNRLYGDLEWERNLYRHPVRQGLWSEEAFIMQHDIYSLGVCLIEIALWQSFIQVMKTWNALGQIWIYRVQYPTRIHGRVDMQLKSDSLL